MQEELNLGSLSIQQPHPSKIRLDITNVLYIYNFSDITRLNLLLNLLAL